MPPLPAVSMPWTTRSTDRFEPPLARGVQPLLQVRQLLRPLGESALPGRLAARKPGVPPGSAADEVEVRARPRAARPTSGLSAFLLDFLDLPRFAIRRSWQRRGWRAAARAGWLDRCMSSASGLPTADRVELVLPDSAGPAAHAAAEPGWWGVERRRGRAGHRLCVPGRRRVTRCPTRAARGNRRACMGRAGSSTPSGTTGPTAAWAGPLGGAGVLGAVFYELHVGTFTAEGTLDAAAGGSTIWSRSAIDVVELMPVGAFPGRWGWGYDGAHPGAVHAAYGGPAALQRFVDAAHGLGLAVCLDIVENHLGPSGNYLSRFGPYFTERAETPWGPAINLDGPSQRRGAAVDPGPRAGLVPGLPPRRPAAGRGARAARRPRPVRCWPSWPTRRPQLAEVARPPAGTGRRDRPQRPAHGRAHRRRRPRA